MLNHVTFRDRKQWLIPIIVACLAFVVAISSFAVDTPKAGAATRHVAAVHRGASVHREAVLSPSSAQAIVDNANLTTAGNGNGETTPTNTGNPWLTPTVVQSPTQVTASSASGSVVIGVPTSGITNGAMQPAGAVLGSGQTSTVATQQPGGVQVAQVIADSFSPRTYIYPMTLPAGYSMSQPNPYTGVIAITTDPANVTQANTMGFIEPAWAKDATGASVPSKYYVWGSYLIQVTTPKASTVFPVVADPSISFGWDVYVHFYHSDVGGFLWINAIGGAFTALSFLCFFTAWFAVLCGVVFWGLTAMLSWSFTYCYGRAPNSGVLVDLDLWSLHFNQVQCVGDNWS